MKYIVTVHCTDNSKGEYVLRLHSEDLEEIFIGDKATDKLVEILKESGQRFVING